MVFAATKRFVGTPLEPLLHFYLPPVPPFTPTVLPPVRLRVNSCSLGSGELQTPITCASPSLPSGGSAWEKKNYRILGGLAVCRPVSLCVYLFPVFFVICYVMLSLSLPLLSYVSLIRTLLFVFWGIVVFLKIFDGQKCVVFSFLCCCFFLSYGWSFVLCCLVCGLSCLYYLPRLCSC